jgi:hypothetical protein
MLCHYAVPALEVPHFAAGDFHCIGTLALPPRPLAPLSAASYLQLSLDLLEKTPVDAFGYKPVGVGAEVAELVQPECVEPQRVLWVELAPAGIGNIYQCLACNVIVRCKAFLDQSPCGTFGLHAAQISGLQDGA